VSDRELILRAAALARRSPQEWSEFLAAFKDYTDVNRERCVSSPLDTLPVAQGRAQNCAALLRLFQECVQTADQITEKRK
jgi:hypothetical protein